MMLTLIGAVIAISVVTGALGVTIQLNEQTVSVPDGGNAVLTCQISAHSKGSSIIKWYKGAPDDGVLIAEKGTDGEKYYFGEFRHRLQLHYDQYVEKQPKVWMIVVNLTVEHFRKEDRGNYSCRATVIEDNPSYATAVIFVSTIDHSEPRDLDSGGDWTSFGCAFVGTCEILILFLMKLRRGRAFFKERRLLFIYAYDVWMGLCLIAASTTWISFAMACGRVNSGNILDSIRIAGIVFTVTSLIPVLGVVLWTCVRKKLCVAESTGGAYEQSQRENVM